MNFILKTTLAAALLAATPVFASDPVVGVWQTPPDRKNLTSLIQVRNCGAKLCGTILKAFDPSGNEVMTKNVGKELFWDMKADGGGKYSGGQFQIPLIGKTNGNMVLSGDKLKLEGCKLGQCGGQTWTRLK